jgi:hypothetical protein
MLMFLKNLLNRKSSNRINSNLRKASVFLFGLENMAFILAIENYKKKSN